MSPATCTDWSGGAPTPLGGRARAPAAWSRIIVVAAFAAALLAAGLFYATVQNIWIDETTQLSGASLSVRELLAWLHGSNAPGFGVPPDRMPPVSYLIDSACSHTLCASPYSFRLLHLVIAVSGLAVLLDLIARRYGLLSTVVAGIILALSPRMIDTAVEIRAYPIVFAITCLQLRALFGLIERDHLSVGRLLSFFALGVLAIYTHFFGLISTMAMCFGLLVSRSGERRDLLAVGILIVALLLCSIGLVPFVAGAAKASSQEQAAIDVRSLVAFLPRAIGHPANAVNPAATLLFFVPLVGLVALCFTRIAVGLTRAPAEWLRKPITAVAAALISGLCVTVLAALVMHGFNPLKPSYSGWTLPLVSLLAAAAVTRSKLWVAAAALPLCAGAVWGESVFLNHSQFFVHGPEKAIRQAIGPDPTSAAVVYVGRDWGFGYFPIWFDFHERVPQWLLASDGSLHRILKTGRVEAVASPPADIRKSRVVLADIRLRSFESLGDAATIPDGESAAGKSLIRAQLPRLAPIAESTEPGLYSVRLTTFEARQ
jgi:hypothetical protein